MKILVVNCGSSSLKYQLIDMETEKALAKGNYERIGENNSFLTHKVGEDSKKIEKAVKNHDEAIKIILDQLTDNGNGVIKNLNEINAVGHRIVHGGEKFTTPVLITDEVIEGLRDCIDLAPLHNPGGIFGIEACRNALPNVKMVVVFDTAFHQTIPKKAYIYPVPYRYYTDYKIRKYGFHGTSHKFISRRVAELVGKPVEDLKIITCHLGQGASICAVKDGKSIDTSMGFTPLGGIPMGTRSGDLDPSIVTFVMKKENLTPDQMDKILNKESGEAAISDVTPDFRDIEDEAAKGNERAILALENYAYLVAGYIGKFITALNGVDVIAFAGGIGENGPNTRKAICKYLEFLGLKFDAEKNDVKGVEREISTADSKIKVYVVPTNEELMIARETKALVV